MAMRTHNCGELRSDHIDQTVTLCGWVNNYRDHGGLIFIDLRDRAGLTQVVFRPSHRDAHALADKLRHEDVIQVTGIVEARGVDPETGKDLTNPRLATGQIEVAGTDDHVFGSSRAVEHKVLDMNNMQSIGESFRELDRVLARVESPRGVEGKPDALRCL